MRKSRDGGSAGCARYVDAGSIRPFSIPNTSEQKATDAADAPSTAPRRPSPIAPFTMATG